MLQIKIVAAQPGLVMMRSIDYLDPHELSSPFEADQVE